MTIVKLFYCCTF